MPAGFNVIENKVQIVKLKCRCPKCKKGFLEWQVTGVEFNTMPPLYRHKCTECEYTEDMNTYYPRYAIKDGDEYVTI